jgi:hypothetical protein
MLALRAPSPFVRELVERIPRRRQESARHDRQTVDARQWHPRTGLVELAVRAERAIERRDGHRRLADPEQIVPAAHEPGDHRCPQ